jgi:predicted unusual protein kinase regulating ubiquinone biosynthesis (AarF/ABC1/UbiB family)
MNNQNIFAVFSNLKKNVFKIVNYFYNTNDNTNSKNNNIYSTKVHYTFENIKFIFDIITILGFEYLYFLYSKNYSDMIHNIITKLCKINILYVKFFQAISLNYKLIDDKINEKIIKYIDNVPYTDEDIDYKTLENITRDYELDICNNNKPINSGMISLVYKLKPFSCDDNDNDNMLILKMKRNNIDQKLEDGINKVIFMLNLLKFYPYYDTEDIIELIHKNINILKEQLDFQKEIENTNLIKNSYSAFEFIIVPDIIDIVTEIYPNCIMMNFINGIKLNEIKEEDKVYYAKQSIRIAISSVSLNAIHGDMHAGNVLFLKNENKIKKILDENPDYVFTDKDIDNLYKIALIDFGIIIVLKEKFKEKLMNILIHLFSNNHDEISNNIIKLSAINKKVLKNIPEEHIINIKQIIYDELLSKIKNEETTIDCAFNTVLKINTYCLKHKLKKYGLVLDDDFFKVQMIFGMFSGAASYLLGDDFFKLMKEAIQKMYHTDLLDDL